MHRKWKRAIAMALCASMLLAEPSGISAGAAGETDAGITAAEETVTEMPEETEAAEEPGSAEATEKPPEETAGNAAENEGTEKETEAVPETEAQAAGDTENELPGEPEAVPGETEAAPGETPAQTVPEETEAAIPQETEEAYSLTKDKKEGKSVKDLFQEVFRLKDDTDYIDVSTLSEMISAVADTDGSMTPQYVFTMEEGTAEVAGEMEEMPGVCDKQADGTITVPGDVFAEDDTVDLDAVEAGSGRVSLNAIEEKTDYDVTISQDTVTVASPYQSKRLIVTSEEGKFGILGPETVIRGFGGISILVFDTEEKTKRAYETLTNAGLMVETDSLVEASGSVAEKAGETEKMPETNGGAALKDVTAAVIDSGYSGQMTERIVSPADINGKGNPGDENGHGTAMADIILNHTPQSVKVMPIKVTDGEGRTSSLKLYLGLMYAIENQVDVINVSMTAYRSSQSAIIDAAILEARNQGIPVIVSAGNFGEDTKDYSPANAVHAITVSAAGADKSFAPYSNCGEAVDYCAYGSMEINGSSVSGTSVSAAVVTAASATALSGDDSLGYEGLISLLDEAAEDLGDAGKDIYFGRGFLSLESIQPKEEDKKAPERSELLTCDYKSLSTEELNAILEKSLDEDMKRFLDGLPEEDRNKILSDKDSYFNRKHVFLTAPVNPETLELGEEKCIEGTVAEYLSSEYFMDYCVQAEYEFNNPKNVLFDAESSYVLVGNGGKIQISLTSERTASKLKFNISMTNGTDVNFGDTSVSMPNGHTLRFKNIKFHKSAHSTVSANNSVTKTDHWEGDYHGSLHGDNATCGDTSFEAYLDYTSNDEESCQDGKPSSFSYSVTAAGSTWGAWQDSLISEAGTCLKKGAKFQRRTETCNGCGVVIGSDMQKIETSYGPHNIDEVNWRYEGNGDYPVDGCKYHACTVCNGEHDDEIGEPHIKRLQYRYSLYHCFENVDGTDGIWTEDYNDHYDPVTPLSGFAYYETPDSDFVTTIFPGFYSGTRATENQVKVPRKTYSVAYAENGATSGTVNTQYDIRCGQYFNISGNGYVRPGYDFTGWNINPDGSGRAYSPGQSVCSLSKTNGDTVTLYAQWKPAIFKITLDHQSGTSSTKAVYEKYTVGYFGENDPTASGTAVDKIAVPTRRGYDFNGYYTGKNGGGKKITDEKGKITAPNTQFTSNATIYAYWTQQVYTMELDSSMEGTEAEEKGTGILYEWFANGFYKKYKDKKVSEELKDKTIETPVMQKEDREIESLTDGKVKKRRYFFDGYFDKNKKIINGETENPEGGAGFVLIGPDYYTDENTTDRKVALKASYIPQRILYYHPNFSDKMQDIGMTEEMISVPEHIWKKPSGEVTLAGPEDDARITDEGYAKICRFIGWNTRADGTGEWVSNLKVTEDTKDVALYAQWEIKFNLAYMGNSQTRGIDFMDTNRDEGYVVEKDAALAMSAKDDGEGYTFFRKKDNNSFTNPEGETITQEVDCSVAGWSFKKDNNKETMYETKEEVLMSELLHSAKKEGDMSGAEVITYGAANPDFGTHDAEPEQGMHGYPGSLLGFQPDNKGSGLQELLKGVQENAWQTPVINLYAVWDKGPVIDAEEEIYFTLNEAKRGDITEEELLKYAIAWDSELDGKTPGGYLKKGEDGENHTEFTVCDYDHRQFEALEHNAMITVMYRATDSIGNITYKQSRVYIVDTTSRRDTEAHTRENARAYLRFISAEYLWTLDEDSLWNTDPVRHQMLLEALDPDTPPQYRIVYTHEDVLRAKEGYDLPAEEFWEKHVEPFIVERN